MAHVIPFFPPWSSSAVEVFVICALVHLLPVSDVNTDDPVCCYLLSTRTRCIGRWCQSLLSSSLLSTGLQDWTTSCLHFVPFTWGFSKPLCPNPHQKTEVHFRLVCNLSTVDLCLHAIVPDEEGRMWSRVLRASWCPCVSFMNSRWMPFMDRPCWLQRSSCPVNTPNLNLT